ncbi:hypothetical protein OG612_45065 (plasmid) [Streptomyces sp. NBC_01527]|uniref:hypothetical protein n=1 Tax=Streptomyces sp. NBC_01527 TaxID=2903894 RepID=UPI002F91A250
MSAVAVVAAEQTRVPGPRRPLLKSVPEQAGPAPDSSGTGDPLRLGQGMRLRLLDAVRALLADPSLVKAPDAARLAAVVLLAKSRAPKGRPLDNQASIWGAELGRWLGMSVSTVHHAVLPSLKKSGAVRTQVVTNAKGQPTGLDCLVMPLWRARHKGGASHPLALSRAELATLLRLIEALFGPGWAPKNRVPTPPGLLAERTGRGAATDRLGLLLMVLNTPTSGWLQLCGGSVNTREGRPAATLAHLLGRPKKLAGARKVLARLTDAGAVGRERRETGSRMNGRGRVKVRPVAQAHRQATVSAPAMEAVQATMPELSDRPVAAAGDHAPDRDAGGLGTHGLSAADRNPGPWNEERPAAAELHAGHASVVTEFGESTGDLGFSGAAGGGESRLPDRASVREDQSVGGDAAAAELTPTAPEVGPLRGANPKKSPTSVSGAANPKACGAAAGAGPKTVGSGKTHHQRGFALPRDPRLRIALAPVRDLWSQLTSVQRQLVGTAATKALDALAGLAGPESAQRLLADRLTNRLQEVGGEARVRDAVGWLLGRGLIQRPACSDRRCDDGIRLDTGGDCPTCGNVIHLRRGQRARIAAKVDAALPDVGETERRKVLEERLRRQATWEAEDFMRRRLQAEAEQTCRASARAEAQHKAERDHAAAQDAEAQQQAHPCANCGSVRSAGLCEACGYRRQTEELVTQTVLVAAAWSADLDDPDDVAAVTAHTRAQLEADMAAARAQFLELMDPAELNHDPAAVSSCLAFTSLQTVQQAAIEYRSCALTMLGRAPQADAEAQRAYDTEKGRRQHRWHPDGPLARAAAEQAADAARERTAQHLLATRLEKLRALERGRAGAATSTAASWRDRLTELAARPISDDPAGTVIT